MGTVSCLSLNARSVCNKLDLLTAQVSAGNFDVVCLSETWANENISDSMLSCNSTMTVHRCDRSNGQRGGGVCILVRKGYSATRVSLPAAFDTCEIVAVDILAVNRPFRLVCVYSSPTSRSADDMSLLTSALSFLCDVERPTVITGDFNVPQVSWPTLTVPNSDLYRVFLDFVIENCLLQFVDEATMHEGDSILDLILCNDEQFVLSTEVREPLALEADHRMISFVLDCTCTDGAVMPCLDYRRADYAAINCALASVDWQSILSSSVSVEECYDRFLDLAHAAVNSFVPMKRRKARMLDYPVHIRQLLAEKRRLWPGRNSVAGKERYRKCAMKCAKEIAHFSEERERAIIESGNIKGFYSYVNAQLKTTPGVSPLQHTNGKLCTSDADKCAILSDQFASVFTVDNNITPPFAERTKCKLSNVDFSELDVYKLLCGLPDKLSSTPDKLPAYFLKRIAVPICFPLCYIFNFSMKSGTVPSLWKRAFVTPVYKKGPAERAVNYRPVSLTSVVCKVMETLVKQCIMSFLRSNNLISVDQHGFLSRRSTVTQLMETLNDWTTAINERKCVTSVYVDLSKAFDTVVHSKLLLKLSKYGISDNLWRWLTSFLCSRTQRVRVGSALSNEVPCSSGVPQGSVLGPLLFLLYINDLPECLKAVKCKLFADDAKIYCIFDKHSSSSNLSTALEQLESWVSTWQLKIAYEKCSVMHLGNGHPMEILRFGRIALKVTPSVRDLGVQISKSLCFSEQCINVSMKASRVVNLILHVFRSKDPSMFVRAFVVFVRPILEYASPIWSPHLVKDVNLVERVQRMFCRRVMYRCNLAALPYHARLSLLNLEPLEHRRIKADLVFLFKILNNMVDLSEFSLFSELPQAQVRTRGNARKLRSRLYPRLDCAKYFFSYRVVNIWNNLPDFVASCPSLAIFKSYLNDSSDLSNLYVSKIHSG